jgi:hypothetical protein
MKNIIFATLLVVAYAPLSLASNFVLEKQNKVENHDHENHDDHSKHSHENKKKKTNDHSDHDHGDHTEHRAHEDNLDSKAHDHEGHSDHSAHSDHKGHTEETGDHSGHDHGSSKAIGKSKAITEVDEEKGFKLSPEAIKTMKLKLTTVDGELFTIAKSTLVTSKNTKGIYRFRGGYFKFLKASSVKEVKGKYQVKVKEVSFGDQIVTNGLGLLRVSDIYSTDKSEYGHAH